MNKDLPDRTFSVAPMMDWTTRHTRYFMRLLSRHSWLYTEMVTTGAILHGDRARLLAHHADERPLALQLGGSKPADLALCARLAEESGFDEVNLNCGCPSDRVQNGRFGACLMAEPQLVAECVAAMSAAVSIPVTVKTRLGIDNHDGYEHLCQFIETVAQGGCQSFILHARKAWLQGLSPKQNREVPPLDYPMVHRIKRDYANLEIILNGGLTDMPSVKEQLRHIDGVMVGREAWHNPWLLASVDELVYADLPVSLSRETVIERLKPYIVEQLQQGVYLNHMTRPLLGLYHGQPGARAWRRILGQESLRPGAGLEVIDKALHAVSSATHRMPQALGA